MSRLMSETTSELAHLENMNRYGHTDTATQTYKHTQHTREIMRTTMHPRAYEFSLFSVRVHICYECCHFLIVCVFVVFACMLVDLQKGVGSDGCATAMHGLKPCA